MTNASRSPLRRKAPSFQPERKFEASCTPQRREKPLRTRFYFVVKEGGRGAPPPPPIQNTFFVLHVSCNGQTAAEQNESLALSSHPSGSPGEELKREFLCKPDSRRGLAADLSTVDLTSPINLTLIRQPKGSPVPCSQECAPVNALLSSSRSPRAN
jgi:hypothetical protein